MTIRATTILLFLALAGGCGSDPASDQPLTKAYVCTSYALSACVRMHACDPSRVVAECITDVGNACCGSENCQRSVLASEDDVLDCTAVVDVMSCSSIMSGTVPTSCAGITR